MEQHGRLLLAPAPGSATNTLVSAVGRQLVTTTGTACGVPTTHCHGCALVGSVMSGPSKSAAVMDGRSVSLSKRQKFFVLCLLSCALYEAALCAGRSVHLHTTVRTDLSACMFVCFVSLVLRPTIHSGSLPAAGLWAWLAKRCVVVCCSTAVNSCPAEFAPASYKVQLLPLFQVALLCCCCFHLGGVGRLGGRIKLHSSYGEVQGQFVLLCRHLWHL